MEAQEALNEESLDDGQAAQILAEDGGREGRCVLHCFRIVLPEIYSVPLLDIWDPR